MSIEKALVSIIIPIYNAESFLEQCIDSILQQTYNNFELLLINDGSTDKSKEICERYSQKDKRVNVYHKKNGGVSSARNLGLLKAQGKWVVFVDSDDWVDPNWLESYFPMNDSDIKFQGFIIENNNKKEVKKISISKTNKIETIYYLEVNNMFGWTWCKIFKNSIIQENQLTFNEEISYNEDLIFTLQFCKIANKVTTIDTSKYHYRINKNSVMHTIRLSATDIIKKRELIFSERKLILQDTNSSQYNDFAISQYQIEWFYILHSSYRNNTTSKGDVDICKNTIKKIYELKNISNLSLSTFEKIIYRIIRLNFSYKITNNILKYLYAGIKYIK
jgi:glycosyltransferase involved in cell wall biosynthesis